jgi:GNAT superfamily N-acetyltransferase
MEPTDVRACQRIHAAATMSSYGRVYSWLQAIVEDPATPLEDTEWNIVAELHAQVVGYASVTRRHLENLFVAPGAQGQGVGAALVREVELRIGGPGPVTLHCLQVNADARRFYERLGYVHVRDVEVRYHGHTLPAWLLAKELMR